MSDESENISWEDWSSSLSDASKSKTANLSINNSKLPRRTAYILLVVDESMVAPQVMEFLTFEEMVAAIRELPKTSFIVPVHGSRFRLARTPENPPRLFIEDESGDLVSLSKTVVASFVETGYLDNTPEERVDPDAEMASVDLFVRAAANRINSQLRGAAEVADNGVSVVDASRPESFVVETEYDEVDEHDEVDENDENDADEDS